MLDANPSFVGRAVVASLEQDSSLMTTGTSTRGRFLAREVTPDDFWGPGPLFGGVAMEANGSGADVRATKEMPRAAVPTKKEYGTD